MPKKIIQKRDQDKIFKKVRPSPIQGILKLLVWSELGTLGNFMKYLSCRFLKICQCCQLNCQKSILIIFSVSSPSIMVIQHCSELLLAERELILWDKYQGDTSWKLGRSRRPPPLPMIQKHGARRNQHSLPASISIYYRSFIECYHIQKCIQF